MTDRNNTTTAVNAMTYKQLLAQATCARLAQMRAEGSAYLMAGTFGNKHEPLQPQVVALDNGGSISPTGEDEDRITASDLDEHEIALVYSDPTVDFLSMLFETIAIFAVSIDAESHQYRARLLWAPRGEQHRLVWTDEWFQGLIVNPKR